MSSCWWVVISFLMCCFIKHHPSSKITRRITYDFRVDTDACVMFLSFIVFLDDLQSKIEVTIENSN